MVTGPVGDCASGSYSERQTISAMTGVSPGRLLGAQFGGKHCGRVFIGSLIGNEIGRSMDEVDRMNANQTINRAHTLLG